MAMYHNQYGAPQDPKDWSHNVQQIPSTTPIQPQYQSLAPSVPWQTGAFRRFPWSGFLAITFALIAAAGMIVVLVVSNNSPVSMWYLSPAVYLAIESAIANILLHYALCRGMTISWWVKAIKGGKVSDLHNIWAHGTSVKDALISGRQFSLVALACLMVALAPINGPLLQRASTVTTLPVERTLPLTILAAQEFPFGYTGTITGRGHQTGFVSSNFSAVVQDYVLKKPVNLTNSNCEGICIGNLRAAGYAISCKQEVLSFNLSSGLAITSAGVNTAITNGTKVFTTSFDYLEGSSTPQFNYTSLYKPGGECWGDLNRANCTLLPAILEYPIVITNNTIALSPSSSYKTDKLIQYTPANSNPMQGPTTHGGMSLALDALFSSAVHLRFTGAVGYELQTSGAPALQYASAGLKSADFSCPTSWTNPTDDHLAAARELAFRTAIHAANGTNVTNVQQIVSRSSNVETVYESHYLFLGLALIFTLLAPICIIPTFLGWWILGRDVSLSPVEIAKAFDAPILANSDSNLDAEELLSEVGGRDVRYGAMGTGGGVYAHNGVLVGGRPEKLVIGLGNREAIEGRMYVG